jgi:hypothetical protein
MQSNEHHLRATSLFEWHFSGLQHCSHSQQLLLLQQHTHDLKALDQLLIGTRDLGPKSIYMIHK